MLQLGVSQFGLSQFRVMDFISDSGSKTINQGSVRS